MQEKIPTPEKDNPLAGRLVKTEDQVIKDQEKEPMITVQCTKPIKLKDKINRGGFKMNLKRDFKFVPEEIIIQKVWGRSNTIVVSAIVPERVLLKERENAEKNREKNTPVAEGPKAAGE